MRNIGFKPQFNYKLTISYDGTNYHGWQVQPNGISIQELLQQALSIICRHPIQLIGSGRTDAGVHALGQIAHFKTDNTIDLFRLVKSLNALLPQDIRVLKVESVPLDFHARYSAIAKVYHYHIFLDKVMDPFRRHYCWHLFSLLNKEELKEAASFFVGTHDFSSFANEAHRGVAAHDSIRTLKRCDVVEEAGGLRLELEADGFLYKMVRNIVGTLSEIGAGKRSKDTIKKLFEEKNRTFAGICAPPQGLFLIRVDYPDPTVLQMN